MPKKLLFIMTRLPFPPNSGRKVSLYHYCRGLHEKYGYDIHIYCFPEWDQACDAENKPDFVKEVRFARPIGKLTKIANLLFRALPGAMPFQCALYYSRANCRAIREMAKEIAPDVIVTDMIRTAPYYKAFADLDAKKILDLDDLLSRRYERQTKERYDVDAAGHYAGGMPSFLRRFNRGFFGKWVLRAEARRTRRAELRYAKLFDQTVFVSDRETKHLNALLGEERAFTVPIGVNAAYFAAAATTEKSGGLCFVGNMNVAANKASLSLIADEILPRLATDPALSGMDHTLHVIGPVSDQVREQYREHTDIVFVGEVDDLRPAVACHAVALLPVAFGSGIKTKILEAMAMGLAVVTNEVGAEGIYAKRGEEFFVEQSPEEIAVRVRELMLSTARAREMGVRAMDFAAREFDWESIFERFALLGL